MNWTLPASGLVRRASFRVLPALAAIAVVAAATPASAQTSPTDAAAAQASYDRGKQLLSEGKYAEACPKLEESQTLDPGAGTQFHLADCWEHIGRTASAWAAFIEVAAASKTAGRADREKISRARAAALEPRLSRLTISVTAKDTPELQIQRDGQVVRSGLWETPIPVDLGTHTIVATAKGKQVWQRKVELTSEGASASVTVPLLLDAPADAGKAVVVVGPSKPVGPGGPSAEPDASRAPGSAQRTIGLVTGAVGIVAMAVSGPVGLAAKSKFNQALGDCVGGCDGQGAAENSSALSMGNAATGLVIGGAVLAAAGVVVWLTAPHRSAPKQSHVGLTLTGGGFLLQGAFE